LPKNTRKDTDLRVNPCLFCPSRGPRTPSLSNTLFPQSPLSPFCRPATHFAAASCLRASLPLPFRCPLLFSPPSPRPVALCCSPFPAGALFLRPVALSPSPRGHRHRLCMAVIHNSQPRVPQGLECGTDETQALPTALQWSRLAAGAVRSHRPSP